MCGCWGCQGDLEGSRAEEDSDGYAEKPGARDVVWAESSGQPHESCLDPWTSEPGRHGSCLRCLVGNASIPFGCSEGLLFLGIKYPFLKCTLGNTSLRRHSAANPKALWEYALSDPPSGGAQGASAQERSVVRGRVA